MEILEQINEIVKNLKKEGMETSLKKFSGIIAKAGESLESEIKWGLSERNFEAVLETSKTIYALTWFYYLMSSASNEENDRLLNMGRAQGLYSHFDLIIKPILTNILKFAEEKGKTFSRMNATNFLMLTKGFDFINTLIHGEPKK
ncbi:MAG: hypothetical protein ACTSSI_05900 [Candidatus Helarchaeota archaeon]